jgi:hypothetical protein
MGCVLVPIVLQIAPPAPADRLALIIEGLCQAIARRGGLGGLAGPFIILVWSRLRRIKARFARHAITPPPIPCRPQAVPKAVVASAAKQSRGRPKSGSPLPLPRRRAWLLRLVPETASGASQLRHFLADPEVTSLLAAAPQLHRILRPLCRMLGIRPDQALPPPSQLPDAAPAPHPISSDAPPRAAPIAVPPAFPHLAMPSVAPPALT